MAQSPKRTLPVVEPANAKPINAAVAQHDRPAEAQPINAAVARRDRRYRHAIAGWFATGMRARAHERQRDRSNHPEIAGHHGS
jgi:hypothetical protein